MTRLLKFFKIDFKGIFFGLGLEQEFFVLPKDLVEKRLDLKYAKRALCGKTFIHSSVSSNYLKKMPDQVLTTLK
jgi:glutamine synthetase type III